MQHARQALKGHVAHALQQVKTAAVRFVQEHYRQAAKAAADDGPRPDLSALDVLVDVSEQLLGALAQNGAMAAWQQIGFKGGPEITSLVNDQAVEWAKHRAAEMVGKRWVDGELVDNPRAEWAITETTRDAINAAVERATSEGWSVAQLTDELERDHAFSSARAEMIARTETAMADVAGNMLGWKESGVVEGTIWLTAGDDLVSEDCQANADAGVIPLGDAYPSGVTAPPDHPNCRCDVAPVTSSDE